MPTVYYSPDYYAILKENDNLFFDIRCRVCKHQVCQFCGSNYSMLSFLPEYQGATFIRTDASGCTLYTFFSSPDLKDCKCTAIRDPFTGKLLKSWYETPELYNPYFQKVFPQQGLAILKLAGLSSEFFNKPAGTDMESLVA